PLPQENPPRSRSPCRWRAGVWAARQGERSMANEGTLKVVLAGCGGMSGAWLKAATAMDGLEIAGLVDVNEEAARKRQAEYGLETAVTGTDLAAVLDRTRPDAVFDCTIPEAHVQVTVEALRHGCHVLGEKPLADSRE